MRRITALLFVTAIMATACGGDPPNEGAFRAGAIVTGSPERLESTLRSMRGKPVVVNYWATWCGPCKTEMPRLVAAAQRYRRLVRFLGVDVQDDRTAARSFANRYRIPFRSLAMSRADVQRTQDILGLPVTQFYRADGELAFVHQGEIEAKDLTEKIEELVRVGRPVDPPDRGVSPSPA